MPFIVIEYVHSMVKHWSRPVPEEILSKFSPVELPLGTLLFFFPLFFNIPCTSPVHPYYLPLLVVRGLFVKLRNVQHTVESKMFVCLFCVQAEHSLELHTPYIVQCLK